MSLVNMTINQLNEASSIVASILSLINIIPGGIGLIFNIVIFSQASLGREPCALYFFWSTCFSLILVLVILPVRFVAVNLNIDMANYNLGICKIEYFTLYAVRSTSSWLVVLACIDRFFHSSSSVRIRRISSLKTARIAIVLISTIVFLVHCHMIVYYEINIGRDRFGNISPSCSGQKGIYSTFFGLWNMVWYSLCPSVLMLLFGLLTLNNLRQHRSSIPVIVEINRISRRTDTQLLRMLTAQVLIITICTLPLSIDQLYISFTSGFSKNTLRIAQENLAARIVGATTYFAHSTTFYLYTLTGTVFRKELFRIVQQCYYLHRNPIAPTRTATHQRPVLQKNPKISPTYITTNQHRNHGLRRANI